MKAKYVKPALVMERFELTQSIANGCGADPNGTLGDPNQWNKSTCGWDMGNFSVWTSQAGSEKCSWVDDNPDAEYSGYCYNHPNGGYSIFNS